MVLGAAIAVYQQARKKLKASIRMNKRTTLRKLCSQVSEVRISLVNLTKLLRRSSEDHPLRIE